MIHPSTQAGRKHVCYTIRITVADPIKLGYGFDFLSISLEISFKWWGFWHETNYILIGGKKERGGGLKKYYYNHRVLNE